MKTTILKIIVFVFTVGLFSNCNQITLTNQEAQALIVRALLLPQKFNEEVNANSNDPLGVGKKCQKIEDNGFVWKEGNWIYGYTLHVTDKGKPYLLGQGKDMHGKNTLQFQAFDIDFNEVTGIAINKEQQTASVRFSLKAINISPISRLLEENINNPRNAELVFKKFDNGWQLAVDQNKPAIDMVKKIWWGK